MRGGTDSVDTLVDSIQQIASKNDQLIKDLQSNPYKSFSTTYFSVDTAKREDDGISIALNAKQVEVTQTYKEFLDSWVVPETGEKLTDPDAGCLFGTSVDLTCNSFADLIRLNEQHKTLGLKYVNLLREKLAMEYGVKFEANLKVIQSHLTSLWSQLFEKNTVTLQEVESQLEDINSRIRELLARIPLTPSSRLDIKSNILTEETKKKLLKMLPFEDKRLTATLIHDNTRGVSNSEFDKAVRGKKDILVIIKATNNYVFGGFVRDTFGTGSGWIKGNAENFLFSFGTGDRNIKLLSEPSYQNFYSAGDCGLHIGYSGDLLAFCSHSTARAQYNIVPPGFEQDNQSISGTQNYTPSVMEVFQVTVK